MLRILAVVEGIVFVVLIIGIAVFGTVYFQKKTIQKSKAMALADIRGNFVLALERYYKDEGRYPARLDDLLVRPEGVANWQGPYLRSGVSRDPWGEAYRYRPLEGSSAKPYELFSLGPDRQAATADDVLNPSF